MSKSDREKILEARLKSLGIDRSSLKIGEEFDNVEFISTGISEIDAILGDGNGLPRGTIIEICGEPQSGKTHIGLSLISSAQKSGYRCAFLNVENAFYKPRAVAIGVDVTDKDKFELYENIETAETYGNLLSAMVKSGEYGVIVVDSINALVPEDEAKKGLDENTMMGGHARLINRLFRKLLSPCATTNTIVIVINQFRTGQGKIPGQFVKTSTGGKGVEYWAHMRLWVDKIGGKTGSVIGDDGEIIGGKSKILIQKTRFGQPLLESVFPVYFKQAEVNPVGEFLYIASARGKEYIKVYRKEYQYLDKNDIVLARSKDPVEFIRLLMEIPPPENRDSKDDSQNVLEYIMNKLKYNNTQKNTLINFLDKENQNIEAPNDYSEILSHNNITNEEYSEEE